MTFSYFHKRVKSVLLHESSYFVDRCFYLLIWGKQILYPHRCHFTVCTYISVFVFMMLSDNNYGLGATLQHISIVFYFVFVPTLLYWCFQTLAWLFAELFWFLPYVWFGCFLYIPLPWKKFGIIRNIFTEWCFDP